jgi:hypothetical protein
MPPAVAKCQLAEYHRVDRKACLRGASPLYDVLEMFFESLGAFAAGTRTKYAQVLKRLFLWSKRKGYITDRLLAAAPPRLQSLIIAALESLCRLGSSWR